MRTGVFLLITFSNNRWVTKTNNGSNYYIYFSGKQLSLLLPTIPTYLIQVTYNLLVVVACKFNGKPTKCDKISRVPHIIILLKNLVQSNCWEMEEHTNCRFVFFSWPWLFATFIHHCFGGANCTWPGRSSDCNLSWVHPGIMIFLHSLKRDYYYQLLNSLKYISVDVVASCGLYDNIQPLLQSSHRCTDLNWILIGFDGGAG